MQTETASALAETEGGREICTGNLQYTLPVASSRSISSLKCRDMRGRPSIYAFYGIIGVHISFGITCGCRCGGPMWYSRSFADAQDDKKPLGMTMLCTRSFTPSAAPSMVTRAALFKAGQRTANKSDLYLIERQIVIKFCCSWSVLFLGGREQGYFVLCCISMNYKKLMFAVLCP